MLYDKSCLQKYLKKRLSHVEKSVLCKNRICANSLNVEKEGTKIYQELSVNVYSVAWGEMEDEFHFVLVCPYIKPYYYRKPSFFFCTIV